MIYELIAWNGLGSETASACLCPKSLNYILEVDSNETEIDYEDKISTKEEISECRHKFWKGRRES